MRDYGKVFSRIWESSDFRTLTDDGRMLVMYLLTCQHGTISGCFRVPDGYACEDLGWSSERVSQGFRNLCENGFANRCETTKWVWIRKFLQWNQPENPNQRKAAVKQAQAVPENCSWRSEFMAICGPMLGIDPNPSLTLVEGFLNQKQKQKQKQEQNTETANAVLSPATLPTEQGANLVTDLLGSIAGPPPCPVQTLVAEFTRRVPDLPRPRLELWRKSAGAEAMAQRWRWLLSDNAVREDGTRYATNHGEAVDWFCRFFDSVQESDFLTGRTGRGRFDLSWLMKRENFMKVVQGNYRTREAA